jgi:HEAT repeat protein
MRLSMQTKYGALFAGILGSAVFLSGTPAHSDNTEDNTRGTRVVYGALPVDQAEGLSNSDQILAAVAKGTPSVVWETLERGERVECLNCIASVESLLYDPSSPATREIAAWWLRRRIFGVFGPGEAYERTVNTLKSDPNVAKRAYAAYALGEFLVTPGMDACADALSTDREPQVRVAAASALGRMNSDGSGALGRALADGDKSVRLAALSALGKVHTQIDTARVAVLLKDGDGVVRKRAAELLDQGRDKKAAPELLALAQNDADSEVRLAACHALGNIGDASVRAPLEIIAQQDLSSLVRDQARIAARRL